MTIPPVFCGKCDSENRPQNIHARPDGGVKDGHTMDLSLHSRFYFYRKKRYRQFSFKGALFCDHETNFSTTEWGFFLRKLPLKFHKPHFSMYTAIQLGRH